MSWLKVVVCLVVLSITLSYVVIPWAAQFASSFRLRATKLSPLSARGLEWRDKRHANAPEPTLRVESIYWSLGGCTRHGRLTLNVEGVTFRVREKDADGQTPKRKRRLPPIVQQLLNYLLHLLLHHWSNITGFVSLRVSDISVVLEDLQGLEVTVRESHLGFGKDASKSGTSQDQTTASAYGRRPSAVLSTAKSTASSIWSHAIGRAVERVAISVHVHDIGLSMPQRSGLAPTLPHLTPRPSHSSLKDAASNTGPIMATLAPLNSLLSLGQKGASPPRYGHSHKLFAIEDESHLFVSIGIGPHRSAMTEDNTRVDVSIGTVHASVDAVETVSAIAKSQRKREGLQAGPASQEMHAPPTSMSLILRAVESATFSCHKAYVSHILPVSSNSVQVHVPGQEAAHHAESVGHMLSLEFNRLQLKLSAASSASDPRLIENFGRNTSPHCAVRGVAAALEWTSIELQCIAPGDTPNERSQLLAVRQASFEVLTSWRPLGWQRQECLFKDDPNLALLIARGSVASLDGATDFQLLGELVQAWKQRQPPKPPRPLQATKRYMKAPPRIRLFLDIGNMSVVVANKASKDAATLSLAAEGMQIGSQSSYYTRAWHDPFLSCEPSTHTSDTHATAHSSDGDSSTLNLDSPLLDSNPLTTIMRGEAYVTVEPISLHLTLGTRNEETYRIATVGQLEGKATLDLQCKQATLEDGSEHYDLDWRTLLADASLGVEDGLKLELWNPEVIQSLMDMASMKEPTDPSPASDPLTKLPPGVSLRLAVGVVSIFIGHPDLNPNCDLKLVHGVWMQTSLVFEYARYPDSRLKPYCRHVLDIEQRKQLRLFNDITSSAFAYSTKLGEKGADAALLSLLLRDTAVTSVYNGARFIKNGGIDGVIPSHEDVEPPPANVDLEYLAWGWAGPKRRTPNHIESAHAPKADLTPGSILRVPHILLTGKLERPDVNKESELHLSARMEHININAYMSDAYCILLAAHTLRRVNSAIRHPALPPTAHEAKRRVHMAILVPTVWVRVFLPLKEQAFLSVSHLAFDKASGKTPNASCEHALLHVQSGAIPGMWDELALIKNLNVAIDLPRAIVMNAMAARLRIPYAYILNQLILNINVAIKTTKLILHNMKSGHFALVKKPVSEQPKLVPNIQINVELMHLEGRDHPIENRLNLACRVGLLEQQARNKLDDMFEQKLNLIKVDDSDPNRPHNHLTAKFSVSANEARWRLDWYKSRNWVKRIKRAKEEQRRREAAMHEKMRLASSVDLPIPILPLEQTVPLMRLAFAGVNVSLAPPPLSRSEIIRYMGDVSTSPFEDDARFSLMVPFELDWSLKEAKLTLRDYPLPILRIHPARNGPAWRVTTLFVIAEELSDDDSSLFIPVEILPERCGHEQAKPLRVQVAKAIMPVKTYARPKVQISSPHATDLTWCTSYSPGLHDMTRVFERLSSPPFDPSSKPGFWDKFRLQLHWRVSIDFVGACRLYLKGSQDPYAITGYGAGFALVWRHNVRWEICQPNAQRETIQVMAEELLVTIPDLSTLHDEAAVGGNQDEVDDPEIIDEIDRRYIERKSIKPCARFLNGIRFGVGFRFERTCRPWTCVKGCGDTDNLFHRQCRFFDFKPHQSVILRNPQAVERLEAEAGHQVDSYEGLRSDYIHFSVSLVAPRDPSALPQRGSHSSFHLSPKAFAHFFAWWALFRWKIPAPIRQGRAFPDSPPPSKKFGKNMATIKYRCDIAPVYLSHVYSMFDSGLWKHGRAQSLGVKFRAGRFRMDGHQRQQEKREWNAQLNRVKTILHKQFYAADLLLDDILIKGIVADFTETEDPMLSPSSNVKEEDEQPPAYDAPFASELPADLRKWYNFFDFIDADYKPFDRNPRMQIVHMGDCPHVFVSRRVKVLNLRAEQNADEELPDDTEASKFGHEKTHVCYLGAALGVGPMQSQIAQERVVELEDDLLANPPETEEELRTIQHRINILNHHIEDMAKRERRHMDDNTLQQSGALHDLQDEEHSIPFQSTVHVHCPRLFFNNNTRNVLYRYYFASNNRKREEYTTSYGALRAVRDGINSRLHRTHNGLNRDDYDSASSESIGAMLAALERRACDKTTTRFKLPSELFDDENDLSRPSRGLPAECIVEPRWRFLVLKPQIALRSTADEDAIILVALEEISVKQYSVIDSQARDDVVSNVLSRLYVAMKGMQGFYPTPETLLRSRKASPAFKQLDFVPLEVFLDVRSETTDYERIVLRSDMGISYDKFNQLRAARGLEWPIAKNEHGETIEHLRRHQNLLEIVIPMITVSATSLHYTAIYYIVTDLFNYSDPQESKRKSKIDAFTFRFDRRDRDPQALIITLMGMQRTIHNLAELQRGYEANVDRLTEQGKKELFRIRTDLLSELEGLFTVFDVINQSRSADAARDALMTQSRKNIRAGNIAWHMLRSDGDPLLKLNIKHTLCSLEDNSDGSVEMALAIDDLQALNSNADALFTEVLSRSARGISKNKLHSNCFISAAAMTLPHVGGLRVVKEFEFYLFPVRFRLEQAVGDMFVDYLFNEKTKTRRKQNSKDKKNDLEAASMSTDQLASSRDASTTALPLTKRHGPNPKVHPNENTRALGTVPDDDAMEMQRRATTNFTFLHLTIGATSFVLDYKRDDRKKQHGFVIPECADFRLEAPQIEYSDEVWSAHDVLQHVMRDIKASAWQQKGDIFSQVIKKTSIFRSKKNLRQIAGITTDVPSSHGRPAAKSPLRYTLQPATPLATVDADSSSLSSESSAAAPRARVDSPSERQSIRSSTYSAGNDGDDERHPHTAQVRRRAHGIMDKLRRTSRYDNESDETPVASPEQPNIRSRHATPEYLRRGDKSESVTPTLTPARSNGAPAVPATDFPPSQQLLRSDDPRTSFDSR